MMNVKILHYPSRITPLANPTYIMVVVGIHSRDGCESECQAGMLFCEGEELHGAQVVDVQNQLDVVVGGVGDDAVED